MIPGIILLLQSTDSVVYYCIISVTSVIIYLFHYFTNSIQCNYYQYIIFGDITLCSIII